METPRIPAKGVALRLECKSETVRPAAGYLPDEQAWGVRVTDEPDLVAACLAGSESAYAEFVRRFESPVYGTCLRMLRDRHEAEDAAQEIFVRAIRGLKGWDRSRPLRPWVLTIAANLCRTYLARRKRTAVGSELPEHLPDRRPDESDANELRDALNEGIAGLREDYRQVFILYHERGLSYEEMSELTAKPIGTLKTWLHRARGQMLDFLKERKLVEDDWNDVPGI